MEPLFTCDDLVLIDPEIKPCPGEYVLAKLVPLHAIVLRKYIPTSLFSPDEFKLLPLNEDWRNIIFTEKNSEVIGTLIEHRCKRRLSKFLK
jgi:SOS-response transcriptional repressor LexA